MYDGNTEILMHDGSLCKIDELKVGDEIMGTDSRSRVIKNIITSSASNMYNINVDDGARFVCTENAILTLVGIPPEVKKKGNSYSVTFSTKGEMQEIDFINEDEAKRFADKVSDDVFDMSIKDYLDLSNRDNLCLYNLPVEFNMSDENVLDIADCLYNIGNFLRYGIRDGYLPRIPKGILLSSLKQRFEFFYDLLDYMNKYYEYHQVEIYNNLGLVKDIEFLSRSIGVSILIYKRSSRWHNCVIKIYVPRLVSPSGDVIDELYLDKVLTRRRRHKFKIEDIRTNSTKSYKIELDSQYKHFLLSTFFVAHI